MYAKKSKDDKSKVIYTDNFCLITTAIALDMAHLHCFFPFILEAYVGIRRKRTPKTKVLSWTPQQNLTFWHFLGKKLNTGGQ